MNECLLKLVIIGLIMECKLKDPYFEKINAQIWNVELKTLNYFLCTPSYDLVFFDSVFPN